MSGSLHWLHLDFEQADLIAFRVQRHCPPAHAWEFGLRHGDLAAQLHDFFGVLIHRLDGDVVDGFLIFHLPRHQAPVYAGSQGHAFVVNRHRLEAPVLHWSRVPFDFPAEEAAVEVFEFLYVVCGDFKMNDCVVQKITTR